MRRSHEAIEDFGTIDNFGPISVQSPQPLFVGRRALAQSRAKERLQSGKALEPEVLGETHQR